MSETKEFNEVELLNELSKTRAEQEKALGSGDYESLKELLLKELELITDSEEKAWIKFRLATISREEALSFYEKIDDPKEWAKLTIPYRKKLLEDARDYERLEKLLAEQIALLGEDKKALALEIYRSYIIAFRLNRPKEAQERVESLVLKDPENPLLLFCLLFLSLINGDWEKVFKCYSELAGVAEAKDELELAKAIWYRLGALTEAKSGSPAEARSYYQKIADRGERELGGFFIKELSEFLSDDSLRIEILEQLVQDVKSEEEPEIKALYIFELVKLIMFDQEEKAKELLIEFLNLKPENLIALFFLEQLARKAGDFELLCRVLEMLTSRLKDKELAFAYLIELSIILLDFLSEPERALTFIKEAKKLKPQEPTVNRLLALALYKAERFEEFLDAINKAIELCDDPKELQFLFIWKAEVLKYKLFDLKRANEAYIQALEIPASQVSILRNLEIGYRFEKEFGSLIKVLTAMEKLFGAMPERSYYAYLRGYFLEMGLKKPETAFSAYGETIKILPNHLPSLLALYRICRAQGAWTNFKACGERVLKELSDPDSKFIFLYDLAYIEEFKLRELEQAKARYEELISFTKKEFLLYEKKKTLAFLSKDYGRVMEVLRDSLELARTGKFKAGIALRLAFLNEYYLNDLNSAKVFYKEASEQGYNSLALLALVELAIKEGDWALYAELIERLAGGLKVFGNLLCANASLLLWALGFSRLDKIGELFKSAYDIDELRGLYPEFLLTAGDFQALLKALEDELERRSARDAILLRMELSELAQFYLSDSSLAKRYLEDILRENQNYVPAIRALEWIAILEKDWTLLQRSYEKEALIKEDIGLKVYLYTKLVMLALERFNDRDSAVSYLKEVLKLKPDYAFAKRLILRLQPQTPLDKVKSIELEIEQAGSLDEKVSLYKKQAEIWDKELNNPSEALKALESALSLLPKDIELLKAIELFLERMERFEELARNLELQAEIIENPDEVGELYFRLGEIYEQKLFQPGKAIEHYKKSAMLKSGDQRPLLALERLLEPERRFEELVLVLEKLSALVSDPSEKGSLYRRIAKIYDSELGRLDEAINFYSSALEIDTKDIESLSNLVDLYKRKGDYQSLARSMEELAKVLAGSDPKASEKLYLSLGELYEQRFEDDANALRCYNEARALSPDSLLAVRALRSILERREDWAQVIELYKKEESLVSSPEEKKHILTTIGKLYLEKLGDKELSADYFEQALSLDIEYLDALKPLCRLYLEKENFSRAKELYEVWEHRFELETDEEQAEVYYCYGKVLERLGELEKATSQYKMSVELVKDHRGALERLFDIFLKSQDLASAQEYGTKLAEALEKQGARDSLSEIYSILGDIAIKNSKMNLATGYYEKALEFKPGQITLLKKLISLYKDTRNWAKILSSYDRLIRSVTDPAEIAKGLVEKGEVLERELNQLESAIAHYRKAVEVKKDYIEGFEHLSKALVLAKKWSDAVEVYDELIRLEKDKTKRVEYNYQLGLIYRDNIQNLEKAKSYFDSVLKLDPAHLPSMEAIGKIYISLKEYEKYLDITHKFVSYLSKTEEAKAVPLYYQMGEIYRDFLNDKDKAILEFQNALRLDPDYEDARAALARLYSLDRNYYPNAIKENLALISKNPFRIQYYRDLGRIYEAQNRLDEAFCVYSVIDLFGALDREEKIFMDSHRSHIIRESQKTMTAELHNKSLVHPDSRGALTEILVALGDYLDKIFPVDLEKIGATKANRVPADSQAPIKKFVDSLARNLGLEDYQLFLTSQMTEPKVAPGEPPCLVLSQEWLNRFTPEERRFVVGKYLEYIRGRFSLVFHYPLPKVVQTIMVFGKVIDPDYKVPGISEEEAEEQAKTLKRAIPRKFRQEVEELIKVLMREGPPQDLTRWEQGIIKTGNRAGLLLCADLETALATLLKLDPKTKHIKFRELSDPIPVLERNEEAIELILFSISETYFNLRKKVGFSLLSV